MILQPVLKLRNLVNLVKFSKRAKISSSGVGNKSELSEKDKEIIRLHSEAEKSGNIFYEDPETGFLVRTKANHILRGKCCGSACRHCPYNQANVKDPSKKKNFNGHFYF